MTNPISIAEYHDRIATGQQMPLVERNLVRAYSSGHVIN